ncbi:MAG: DISARM system SNF2-like helicase DrmD [Phycisphaeraceae bacterium]
MSQIKSSTTLPRVGMLAVTRNRRGIVSEVRPFGGSHGPLQHLVRLEYKDDLRPERDELIWELEPDPQLLPPGELPSSRNSPMPPEDFDALVRAARWTAISPFIDPDHAGPATRLPISAPFHGAVEIDDFQLVPLLKALRMPRVSLLIADDVGIGKTIETGLIISELVIRRRVNRILILTPASLRIQWRDEMWSKFAMPFDVIDKNSTLKLKRSLGIDANPWRSTSRTIASYHYLRQPDVLEQFLSASRTTEGSAHLPWDMLIVDEVHNLMPAPIGEDSLLCQMLRQIAPLFEHRVFLTATPHNGHTRSFTGLLESLDPVRFTQTDELRPAERERVKQVVIRRLKREINERTNPPRFCTRKQPQAMVLNLSAGELALVAAFDGLRTKVRSLVAQASKQRRLAGSFAIEILGKRLLSGPMTFLESWRRCKAGMLDEQPAADEAVLAAEKVVNEETADDRETQQRQATAAGVVGSWMKAIAGDIASEIAQIDAAAHKLKVKLDHDIITQDPADDARYSALCILIRSAVQGNGKWLADERLVVFTEYKTTLDYLLRRLRHDFSDADRFLCLFGGMDDPEREQIKQAFNDPETKVRLLLATDAASEGLNLQSTARYLLHYDCPWNPSRLEQRNGRLDRHGQARDVQTYHFASDQHADLKFMDYLIRKIDQIREDLGATGDLFDEATHRRLIEGEEVAVVQQALDLGLSKVKSATAVPVDDTVREAGASTDDRAKEQLDALAQELDLDATACHSTLETALAQGVGHPQLGEPDALGRFDLKQPDLPGWKDLIDQSIRLQSPGGALGPVPRLTFSPDAFMVKAGPRTVFRPRRDTLMLHLSHPIMQKATGALTRLRFPGPMSVSRWAVRLAQLPKGTDAQIVMHLEELAVNELRETFHHWVRTIQIPVKAGELQPPLPHEPAIKLRKATPCRDEALTAKAAEMLDDLQPELGQVIAAWRKSLTEKLVGQLAEDGEQALKDEEQRYQSRQGEVSTLIAENTLAKLEREIGQLKAQRKQGLLFGTQSDIDALDRSIEMRQEELSRRRAHYEEIREQLARERERIVKVLLPKRYALQGEIQVFPVAVEIRLPAGGVP